MGCRVIIVASRTTSPNNNQQPADLVGYAAAAEQPRDEPSAENRDTGRDGALPAPFRRCPALATGSAQPLLSKLKHIGTTEPPSTFERRLQRGFTLQRTKNCPRDCGSGPG